MHKIAFVIYRKWAYQIFESLYGFKKERNCFSIDTLITIPQKEFILNSKKYEDTKEFIFEGNDIESIYKTLKERNIQTVLFFGWSWIVKEPLLSDFTCLCLHPSLLPKYRGGTPIQHQLINGEKTGGVTVFKMDAGIDSGDIYKQLPMSLAGDVNDIFARMTDLGTVITKQFIIDYDNNEILFKRQKKMDKYPPLKRRKPDDGKFELDQLKKMDFNQLNDIVRGLLNPFPNAHINFNSGRLLMKGLQKYTILPHNSILIESDNTKVVTGKRIFIQLKDSFANITDFEFIQDNS